MTLNRRETAILAARRVMAEIDGFLRDRLDEISAHYGHCRTTASGAARKMAARLGHQWLGRGIVCSGGGGVRWRYARATVARVV